MRHTSQALQLFPKLIRLISVDYSLLIRSHTSLIKMQCFLFRHVMLHESLVLRLFPKPMLLFPSASASLVDSFAAFPESHASYFNRLCTINRQSCGFPQNPCFFFREASLHETIALRPFPKVMPPIPAGYAPIIGSLTTFPKTHAPYFNSLRFIDRQFYCFFRNLYAIFRQIMFRLPSNMVFLSIDYTSFSNRLCFIYPHLIAHFLAFLIPDAVKAFPSGNGKIRKCDTFASWFLDCRRQPGTFSAVPADAARDTAYPCGLPYRGCSPNTPVFCIQ